MGCCTSITTSVQGRDKNPSNWIKYTFIRRATSNSTLPELYAAQKGRLPQCMPSSHNLSHPHVRGVGVGGGRICIAMHRSTKRVYNVSRLRKRIGIVKQLFEISLSIRNGNIQFSHLRHPRRCDGRCPSFQDRLSSQGLSSRTTNPPDYRQSSPGMQLFKFAMQTSLTTTDANSGCSSAVSKMGKSIRSDI